ncbi:hypothetical protein [Rubripirellula obstinata]|uniref:hypothetical protein n=1 Tax=Rubripirellula obstinata TaxID=406547 RepID=UPI0012F9DF6A|nr:hypothetical protein [Rubripirellula obstinata]
MANEDEFRRWLRRIVLVASVLAIGCHACWTVLVYRNFGFASPLLIAALYGNLAGSQPYLASATAAFISNTVFFLTFTCFLMTGRKLGVRFAKPPILAAPTCIYV